MDAYRSGKGRVEIRMTVEEAAHSLGAKEESVRKCVRRKKMHSEKDEDGRLYVYVESSEHPDAVRSADESRDISRELIESKDETIRILQVQLQKERETGGKRTGLSRSSPRPTQFSHSGLPIWKPLGRARRPPREPRRARQGRSRKVRASLVAQRGPGTPPTFLCADRCSTHGRGEFSEARVSEHRSTSVEQRVRTHLARAESELEGAQMYLDPKTGDNAAMEVVRLWPTPGSL